VQGPCKLPSSWQYSALYCTFWWPDPPGQRSHLSHSDKRRFATFFVLNTTPPLVALCTLGPFSLLCVRLCVLYHQPRLNLNHPIFLRTCARVWFQSKKGKKKVVDRWDAPVRLPRDSPLPPFFFLGAPELHFPPNTTTSNFTKFLTTWVESLTLNLLLYNPGFRLPTRLYYLSFPRRVGLSR